MSYTNDGNNSINDEDPLVKKNCCGRMIDNIKSWTWKTWLRLLLLIVLIVIIILVVTIFRHQVADGLKDFLLWIEKISYWGPLILCLVYIPSTVFFIPGSILTLGAGFAFNDLPPIPVMWAFYLLVLVPQLVLVLHFSLEDFWLEIG